MKTKQEEIEELRKRLDALEKGLKEEGNERWKPESNGFYYTIDACNNAVCPRYDGDNLDNQRYEAFNMFQTQEEAEKIAKYQLIFRKLYDFAKRNNEGVKGSWIIAYNDDSNEFNFYALVILNYSTVRFSSKEVAEKAIEYIGEEDMKWYLTFKA